MDNRYKEGGVVYAKANPGVNLVIRRFVDDIYYCRIQHHPELKELVYFERELSSGKVPDALTTPETKL